MKRTDIVQFQKFAEKLALGAGNILLAQREKTIIKKRKRDYLDIATTADLASEEFLLGKIHKRFPTHNIISEEKGEETKGSDFTWFIDPLDGTKEYIRGTPIFNVSLTLEYKTQIIIGTVFRPASNELFSSSKGNGAYLNGRRLRVTNETNLRHSIIGTHLPYYENSTKEIELTLRVAKELIRKANRLRAFQEDVTSLSWVALGALEGYVLTISGPKWWDVAPGILMVKEAGGIVTDTNGNEIKNRDLSKGLVASNGKIHQELLKIIQVKNVKEKYE